METKPNIPLGYVVELKEVLTMKISETSIPIGGVIRCCLASVATEYHNMEVQVGYTSVCKHCQEPFTLTSDYEWIPDWLIKQRAEEAK